MNLSDYGENKVFDALFRGQALGAPAIWYIALGTNLRSDNGSPTEPAIGAYARASIAASLTNFNGTQGTTSSSSGTDGTGENAATISFPTSTAAWGTIQSVWFMDAASAGNCWVSIDLAAPVNVSAAGFTLSFANGQLSFQIDN